MRKICLKEYAESNPHTLSITERDLLSKALPSLTLKTVSGTLDSYHLKPDSTVGAVEIGDLSILIRPKIGIPALLSLACYAIGRVKFQTEEFDFPEENALHDVLALALGRAARMAFARGLLHGYRTEEEAIYTVRGRIRFDEQIRRRFGIALPVEVRYDEFTDDILANRLAKAAAYRLGHMGLRSPKARNDLGWIAGMLDNVSPVEFPAGDVPEVRFDRLNEHYRGVVALSRLILRHSEFQANRGAVRSSGFLVDMNKVFQDFVTVALREALGVSERTFGESGIPSLDEGARVHLRPDLVWRDGSSCVFVGDAKYKNITGKAVPESDIYQMLAYVTALDLPGGMLVYAKGEAEPVVHTVRHTGKAIEVASLNLSGRLEDILADVGRLAGRVRALRDEALSLPSVA